jgi:ATP-dependent RNA helicase RhlE
VATTFVMPQEKSDARKLERELKIKFEWREADKNLEKEERNKPLDLTTGGNDLLALETRSWKSGDASAQAQARNIGSSPYKGNSSNGFRSRAGSGGSGGRSASGRPGSNGRASSNRPGSSRSGPARRGQ